jgi:hypothetical protein
MGKMFSYIKRKMGGLLWKKIKPANSASNQQAEWYRTCSQCPLDKFIRCLVDGDLSALIIRGNPSLPDLAEAWANIYAEYLDLNDDNETAYILLLQRDIALEQLAIIEVSTALNFLATAILDKHEHFFHPSLIDVLRRHDIDFPFDLKNREEYAQSIEFTLNRINSMQHLLEVKVKELDSYMADKSNNTIDALYFDRTLVRLARFRHCAVIRASEITVKEFVLMLKDFLDYMKVKTQKLPIDGEEG